MKLTWRVGTQRTPSSEVTSTRWSCGGQGQSILYGGPFAKGNNRAKKYEALQKRTKWHKSATIMLHSVLSVSLLTDMGWPWPWGGAGTWSKLNFTCWLVKRTFNSRWVIVVHIKHSVRFMYMCNSCQSQIEQALCYISKITSNLFWMEQVFFGYTIIIKPILFFGENKKTVQEAFPP